MEVLDEKANGGPTMDIDEVVSVKDRAFSFSLTSCLARLMGVFPLDEAFAAKHMPDLGHDVKEFMVYTWKLNHWKKLEKKMHSPEFECGGHKWCVPFAM